jgi:hypothetical protein
VSVLYLPLFGSIFGWDFSNNLEEKRVLTRCPVPGTDPIKSIPEKFEAFYKDHFGFRNGLIQGHNWLKYRLCKGASYGKVLFGKEDWLFLTKSQIITNFLGQIPLTSEELASWKNTLEYRQQFLAEQGIRYLFVIVPNKITIYPEMLPDHIRRFKGRTRMDQLVDYLRDNCDVEFLDLREVLSKAKEGGLIYYPQDSHWTDRGAFIGYYEICHYLSKWFADFKTYSLKDFKIVLKEQEADLASMLGLGETLVREFETLVPYIPREASKIELILPNQYAWPRHVKTNKQLAMENKSSKHRLLLFHDSFAERGGLRELLGEHFSRSAFVPVRTDIDCFELLVAQERPDVVIEQIVERKLNDKP